MLAAARAVNTGGLSMAMAFMSIYMVNERGLAATVYAGLFLAANSLQSLSQGLAGEVSDRLGRKAVMLSALSIRSLVVTALGFEVLAGASIWAIAGTLVVSPGIALDNPAIVAARAAGAEVLGDIELF